METCSLSDQGQNLELVSTSNDDYVVLENDNQSDHLTLETPINPCLTETHLRIPDQPTSLKSSFDEDCLPTFYETIPTLQEMSSLVVAIALWRLKISLRHNSCLGYLPTTIYKEVEKLLQELPVPRMIRKIIESSLAGVRKEIDVWFRYYKQNILTSRRGSGEGTIKIGDLLFCHWLPDGKIDHRESALNMLKNPRLTQGDKFRIISTYCLADEIETLSADSLQSYFTDGIDFNGNALMYYWLCYMKADLDKIPNPSDESIASCMITAPGVNTWSAIEYFWDLLKVDEQTYKVEQILDRRPEFQKKLLSKMSESQKFHLFSTIPIKIMKNFWHLPGQVRFAFSTWIYIRNFVDCEQFKQLMKSLAWDISLNIDEKVRCLVDIANHCPDHLKSFAFQPSIMGIIIDTFRFGMCIRAAGDKQLITDYLYFASVDLRKEIIFERADTLVSLLDSSFTEQMIKLCLPNAQDVIEFKKYALKSDYIQDRLVQKLQVRGFQTLYWFLDYYCLDSCARSEFCCKILESLDLVRCRFHKIDDWINIIELIDENLLHTLPNKASKFKKKVAFSFALRLCELWSQDEKVGEMIEKITQVLDAEEVVKFKVYALGRVEGYYEWEKFDENFIGGFLMWCCNDDVRKVSEFKKTLSIRRIFHKVWCSTKFNCSLQGDADYETVCKVYEPLDKFLHWYFENPADVKIFKLEKVYGNKDALITLFSRKGYSSKDAFSRNTLPWFFDGDRDAVVSFKNMHKNGSLALSEQPNRQVIMSNIM